MSGVVIRCTHCGTTQASLGECEACHEGDTRYFCPNHTPGQWLDEASCDACGARVGVPGRSERPVTPPPPPRPTPPLRREIGPPVRSRDPRPLEPDLPDHTEWRHATPEAELRGMLEELMRATTRVPTEGRPELPPAAFKVPLLFGCVANLIKLGVILFILAILAFMFLFGG